MASSPADRSVSLRSLTSLFVLLALVIVWGAAPAAQAPVTFGTGVPYTTNSGSDFPATQAVGDFNNDGASDIIVVDGSQPTRLRLRLGTIGGGLGGVITLTPSGSCSPNTALTCITNSGQVLAVDVNADDKLDIVTANNHSRNLSVILGNGDATFQAATNYALGGEGRAVAIGDLNNDGKVDLVGGDSYSIVRVFPGNGDGTFGDGVTYTDGGINRQAMVVADMDNDGNNDVLVGNRDTADFSVFRGHGNGTLSAWNRYPHARGDSLIVEDFNGDGRLDVAAPGHDLAAQKVIVMLGTGGGALGGPVGYPTSGVQGLYMTAAEMNGDNHTDLVVSHRGTHTLAILTGDGAGGFGTATLVPTPVNTALIHDPLLPALGDFDADGRNDVSVVVRTHRTIVVWRNTTEPSDTTPPSISSKVNGTATGDGWYTSNVGVTWSVTDAESDVTTSGCDAQSVTSDTSSVTFTCTATSAGGTSSSSVTIKRDTTGPAITSATANPGMLWPPNNKMVAVTVTAVASDAGAGLASCIIDSVNSNEGGSAHEPDVQLTGDLTLNLRAEREGKGAGRVYSIQVSCRDAAGNTSSRTTTVSVPHDQGKK
ncbi:MAG: VCBS repeat-containing protein [Acidobacteriota bacterium]|nr:VCBS repeat-containing protein [Acidobacteriota bacterium]